MGLMKSYATALAEAGGNKAKVRREAARAEAWIREKIRMSFVTDAEFRAWLLKGSRRRWEQCEACPLHRERTRVVYGEGVEEEPLLFVLGEAPGPEEDRSGTPLMGRPGSLLRRACLALGIDLPAWAYASDAVLCRTPGGRRPKRAERLACLPRLEDQLDLLQPRVILLLGASAGNWVGRDYSDVERHRGLVPRADWPRLPFEAKHALVAVFLTHHPAWILGRESKVEKGIAMRELAEDLRKVKRLLDLLDRRRSEARLRAQEGE